MAEAKRLLDEPLRSPRVLIPEHPSRRATALFPRSIATHLMTQSSVVGQREGNMGGAAVRQATRQEKRPDASYFS